MEQVQALPNKRFRWNSSAVTLSVMIHVVFLVAAAFIVALKSLSRPEAQFVSENPARPKMEPRKIQMKVKVRDLQKRSARPKLQPRLLANTPSPVSVPEIKKSPKPVNRQVRRNFATMGVSGFGSGIGGGDGAGFGGGFGGSFFGLKSSGKRFAYLIDYSGSMKGLRYDVMRNELSKSIQELPAGAQVSLVFFSGPAWIAGENPREITKNWEKVGNTVRPKKGEEPKPKWVRLSRGSKKELLEIIRETPMTYGTDWANPFNVAFDLVPKPDVIFFMTDGSPQAKNEAEVLEMVEKWNRTTGREIPINAIAIGDPRVAGSMEELAKDSAKGQFTVVDVNKYKFSMGYEPGAPAGKKNKKKGKKKK